MLTKLFKNTKKPRIGNRIKVASSAPKRYVMHIIRDMKINQETQRLIQYG